MNTVSYFNFFVRCTLACLLSWPAMAIEVKYLTPKIRIDPSSEVPNGVPVDELKPFWRLALFMDESKLINQPRILHTQRGQNLNSDRDLIYSINLNARVNDFVSVYRKGKKYYHPKTKECLGYMAFKSADAELLDNQEVSVLQLSHNQESINKSMRLLVPKEDIKPAVLSMHNVVVTPFKTPVEGYIVGTWIEGATLLSKHDVVVLSLGECDGIEVGSLLDIYSKPEKFTDKGECKDKKQLSVESRVGRVLVYQVDEKLSVGLIWELYDTIKLLDKVKNT